MNAINTRKPFRNLTWNEYYTNERQSRDSNRSATNAGSTRTQFRVFRMRYDRQRTLVIRIAAITLASDSAITIARFCPSKVSRHIPNFLAPPGTPSCGRPPPHQKISGPKSSGLCSFFSPERCLICGLRVGTRGLEPPHWQGASRKPGPLRGLWVAHLVFPLCWKLTQLRGLWRASPEALRACPGL